jgi:hypothetical protein
MAQSLEQINQSLKHLEQQAIDLGDKLHIAHQGYRQVLAQTAHEQLIMACFTLCTEAYPKEFLQLSVNERHQLQTNLRAIGQKMQQDLREVTPPDTPIADLMPAMPTIAFPDLLALPGNDALARRDAADDGFLILDEAEEEEEAEEDFDDEPEDDAADRRAEARSQQIEAELKALFSLESLLSQRQPQLPQNPVEQISFWHRHVEDQAQRCLRRVSADANQTFQTAKLLPSQIPAPILEAASMAEGGESFGKTPHLVRMILEAREKPPESDRSQRDASDNARRRSDGQRPPSGQRPSGSDRQRPSAIVNLITLQLRIGELEFHDINLTTWRNQIRNLLKELKTISKEYQKKQHQQAIANAKMAWRATWTND